MHRLYFSQDLYAQAALPAPKKGARYSSCFALRCLPDCAKSAVLVALNFQNSFPTASCRGMHPWLRIPDSSELAALVNVRFLGLKAEEVCSDTEQRMLQPSQVPPAV